MEQIIDLLFTSFIHFVWTVSRMF